MAAASSSAKVDFPAPVRPSMMTRTRPVERSSMRSASSVSTRARAGDGGGAVGAFQVDGDSYAVMSQTRRASEVGDGALLGTLRESRVLREEAARVARFGQLPTGAAGGEGRVVDEEVDGVPLGVDDDAVAVLDERDRSAVDGPRRDVTDAEAVRAAGESTVGDEGRVGAAAGALHRTGDREHLTHAGPALRALVANDDDVARLDATGEDLLHRGLFAVEDAGAAVEEW